MLSYVLFLYAAFDFPIRTLRLLHSLALASQLTLCTPFASVLSGFSTNTRSLSLLNSHSAHLLHPFSAASQLTLPLASLCFSRRSRHVSRNARGQGHAGPFHETIHLKRRPTTHWCTRRCRGSRDIVYGSADILGLLSTILHRCKYYIENYVLRWYSFIRHFLLRWKIIRKMWVINTIIYFPQLFSIFANWWILFKEGLEVVVDSFYRTKTLTVQIILQRPGRRR